MVRTSDHQCDALRWRKPKLLGQFSGDRKRKCERHGDQWCAHAALGAVEHHAGDPQLVCYGCGVVHVPRGGLHARLRDLAVDGCGHLALHKGLQGQVQRMQSKHRYRTVRVAVPERVVNLRVIHREHLRQHTVSTPNIGPLQTLDQDLRTQQITLPDPTKMLKRPNVLCCYGNNNHQNTYKIVYSRTSLYRSPISQKNSTGIETAPVCVDRFYCAGASVGLCTLIRRRFEQVRLDKRPQQWLPHR